MEVTDFIYSPVSSTQNLTYAWYTNSLTNMAAAVEDHLYHGATTDATDKLKKILVFDGLVTSSQLALLTPHGL